jgi:hypothetical protein
MKKLSLVSLALLAFLVFSSCGTTGGKLIRIGFRAGGMSRAAGGPLTFTTPIVQGGGGGWTVTLQTARIALGPFYFNVSPPPTDSFRGGVVIIEATEQVVLDPLDPALRDVAGGADGETGDSLVCEIGLLPPDAYASASDRQLLSNGIPGCNTFPAPGTCPFGYVAGTATKGTTTVPFAGPIAISPNLVNQLNPLVALQRVNGATASLRFTEQTQAVEMRVDPTHWFDSVNFSALLGGTQLAGNYTWSAGNCVQGSADFDGARCGFQNALVAGVQQSDRVYAFAVKP